VTATCGLNPALQSSGTPLTEEFPNRHTNQWHTAIVETSHSVATHIGERNVPLQAIMAKTRHRNPRTAMRYIKPGAEAVAEVTELLDLGRGHR